jgi:LysR family nitrogen assimilation transcriptional regulator
MDLRQLRYFVGAIQAGSLSRAAAELHVAQSAISQHLANLESELRTRLLERGPSGVSLTPAGQVLYAHAQSILRHVEVAKQDTLSVDKGLRGDVSVGLPFILSPILSYRLFISMRARHPNVRLKLVDGVSSHLRELVQNGRLDMAVLFIDEPTKGLRIVRPLLVEELFYISGDRRQQPISFAEALAGPLLLPSKGSGIMRVIDAELARRGLSVEPLGEIDSMSTLKQAAVSGIGATVLPWSALYGEEERDALGVVRFTDVSLTRPVSICAPAVAQWSTVAEAVAADLAEITKNLVADQIWQGASLPLLGSDLKPSLSKPPL